MEWRPLITKFVKFAVVGASGAVIDFGLTALCKGIFGIPELLSNAIGFTVAATSNYFLNRVWTWRSTSKEVGVEYAKFFFVSLVGLGLNSLIVFMYMPVSTSTLSSASMRMTSSLVPSKFACMRSAMTA